MCGIAGIIGTLDTSLVQSMIDLMVHRGPDDDGVQALPDLPNLKSAVLGHRRLSIIDLSKAGHQPMSNEDGTLWTVFNGEIYNFAALRVELEHAGHQFASHTDTEVILHGYEEWGTACVDRFNGMFAFALVDTRQGELLLVRDRLGVKPLYYAHVGGLFAFASEAKALLDLPGFSRRIDPEALELYLALGYVPWPRSLFAGVHKLPPGHLLRLRGGAPQIREYWRMPSPQPVKESFDDQLDELRQLLESSVTSRMVSDVPVGCLLSGGLDSGMTTAIMARLRGDAQRLDTFCVGYEMRENRHTEHGHANIVARHLGTRHHEVTCSDEWAVTSLPRLIWHMDEPLTDDTIPPYAKVCELARRDVTVVLSGEGADEFLYGYRYYALEKVRRLVAIAPRSLRRWGRGLLERHGDAESLKVRAVHCCLQDTSLDSFLGWSACFTAAERRALAGGESGISQNGEDGLLREALRSSGGTGIDMAPGLDARFRMVDYILNRSDKLSMAASLELREPLLDYRLIELLSRVPVSRKIKGFEGKYLLRRAAEGLLPPEIVWRRKKPFAAPVELWLRPLRDRYLRQSRLAAAGVIDGGFLHRLLTIPLHGGPVTNRVWALAALEIWFRVFIEREQRVPDPVLAAARPSG